MTSANDLFPSRYLKGSDAETDLTLTITKVTKEKMKDQDGNEEIKPVIYFTELEKGLVLNKTNNNVLIDLFGDTIETWTGQHVTLTAVEGEYFGKVQKALRFRVEAPLSSHDNLLRQYTNLLGEAYMLKVTDLDTFNLAPDATDATIIELSKTLREKVKAAKEF